MIVIDSKEDILGKGAFEKKRAVTCEVYIFLLLFFLLLPLFLLSYPLPLQNDIKVNVKTK